MATAAAVAAAKVEVDTATAVAVMAAEAEVGTAALVVAAKAKSDMATATTAEMDWVVAAMAVAEARGSEAAAVARELEEVVVEPEEAAKGMRRESVVGMAAVATQGERWARGAARRGH